MSKIKDDEYIKQLMTLKEIKHSIAIIFQRKIETTSYCLTGLQIITATHCDRMCNKKNNYQTLLKSKLKYFIFCVLIYVNLQQ